MQQRCMYVDADAAAGATKAGQEGDGRGNVGWGGGTHTVCRDGWREGFKIRNKGGRVSGGMRQDGANWMMWEERSDRGLSSKVHDDREAGKCRKKTKKKGWPLVEMNRTPPVVRASY